MTLYFTLANWHLCHLQLLPTSPRTLGHYIGKVCSVFEGCIIKWGGASCQGNAPTSQGPPTSQDPPTPRGQVMTHSTQSFPGKVCAIVWTQSSCCRHKDFNSSQFSHHIQNKAWHRAAVHWISSRMKNILLLLGKGPLHIHSLSHSAIWSECYISGAGDTVVN